MFELIANFISELIQKAVGKAIDIKADNIRQRQISFTSFFEFYKALFDYEVVIEHAIDKIKKFQSAEAVLLKREVERLIKEIFEAHEKFYSKLSLIKYHFSIYLPSVIIELNEFNLVKPLVIYNFMKSVDIIPIQELTEKGGLTYLVSYPTRIPSNEEVKALEQNYKSKLAIHLQDKEAIRKIEREILNELKLLSNSKSIDFENNHELDEALQNSADNLQRIKQARTLLAKFIRDNFELKDILI